MTYIAIILATVCMLTACGDSDGSTDHNNQVPDAPAVPTSYTVTAATELPACDAARQAHLVYLLAEKQFQTCQAGAWVVIDMAAPVITVPEIVAAITAIEIGKPLAQQPPATQTLVTQSFVQCKLATSGTFAACPAILAPSDNVYYGTTAYQTLAYFSIEVKDSVVARADYRIEGQPVVVRP